MQHYFVNRDALRSGEHEVHTRNCDLNPDNSMYLGHFATCEEAIAVASEIYPKVDGCYTCSRLCHSR